MTTPAPMPITLPATLPQTALGAQAAAFGSVENLLIANGITQLPVLSQSLTSFSASAPALPTFTLPALPFSLPTFPTIPTPAPPGGTANFINARASMQGQQAARLQAQAQAQAQQAARLRAQQNGGYYRETQEVYRETPRVVNVR